MCNSGIILTFQVKALLASGINRPRKGSDAGDHPPITPMRSATEAELGTLQIFLQTIAITEVGCHL